MRCGRDVGLCLIHSGLPDVGGALLATALEKIQVLNSIC